MKEEDKRQIRQRVKDNNGIEQGKLGKISDAGTIARAIRRQHKEVIKHHGAIAKSSGERS